MRYKQIPHEVNIVLWQGRNVHDLVKALEGTSFDFSVTPTSLRAIVESPVKDESISVSVGQYLVVYPKNEWLITIDEQTFREDFERIDK